MTNKKNYRTETDLLGSKEVPEEVYYGVQTSRAIDNFHISGHLLSSYPNFIRGMAITKKAAATAHTARSPIRTPPPWPTWKWA